MMLGGKEKTNKTVLIDYLDTYFENLTGNRNFSHGTKKNYRNSINHLKAFLQQKKMENLDIGAIRKTHATDFKNFLETDNTILERKGMKAVSSSSIIKNLKPIFSRAVENKLISEHPFNEIKLSNRWPNKKYLSVHQVAALAKLELSDSPTLDFYRDFFLFSIYTGLSFVNGSNLTSDLYTETIDNRIKLSSERMKTSKPVKQIMNKYALAIVKKYESDISACGERLLNGKNELILI